MTVYLLFWATDYFQFHALEKLPSSDETGIMVRVFTTGLGDWGSIPGRVIPKT